MKNSSEMWRRIVWQNFTNVSEGKTVSIFRVEDVPSKGEACSCAARAKLGRGRDVTNSSKGKWP